ncbi:MAG: hypothetical protein HZB83_07850 [Deltaproteobacteria bacterium]|nr:hypothetical protein [Deltaproteobacteria bacterium]
MEIKDAFSINRGLRLFIAAACIMVFAVTGCGKDKKEKTAGVPDTVGAPAGEAPAGHPAVDKTAEDITKAAHGGIKTQKEVRLSEEVRARWKEVKLQITDASSRATGTVTIKVGGDVKLTNDGYRLRVETFVPDYAIADKHIESRSSEPKNPAVLVNLLEGDKSVARGWIFKDFPVVQEVSQWGRIKGVLKGFDKTRVMCLS